jgi:hypothetical protein
MNITSALSKEAAEQVRKTVKPMGNELDTVHFQAIENRVESPEGDNIYIQRILDDTGEDKQGLLLFTSEVPIFAKQYQFYKQNVPKTTRSNRFIYCIVPCNKDKDKAIKPVCVVLLSQSRMQSESGMSSDYEYEVSLYYITVPLKGSEDQLEPSSDIKDKIVEMVTDWDEFRECVKVDSFTTGRLWEMPIQFPGLNTMYLTMHEPVARPSILNVILQRYSGISVSKKSCTSLIFN